MQKPERPPEPEPLNELDIIAAAAAKFRDPGGLPWAEKPEVYRENWRKLVRLIRVLLENEPDDLVADGGHTVLDDWRYRARAALKETTDD